MFLFYTCVCCSRCEIFLQNFCNKCLNYVLLCMVFQKCKFFESCRQFLLLPASICYCSFIYFLFFKCYQSIIDCAILFDARLRQLQILPCIMRCITQMRVYQHLRKLVIFQTQISANHQHGRFWHTPANHRPPALKKVGGAESCNFFSDAEDYGCWKFAPKFLQNGRSPARTLYF